MTTAQDALLVQRHRRQASLLLLYLVLAGAALLVLLVGLGSWRFDPALYPRHHHVARRAPNRSTPTSRAPWPRAPPTCSAPTRRSSASPTSSAMTCVRRWSTSWASPRSSRSGSRRPRHAPGRIEARAPGVDAGGAARGARGHAGGDRLHPLLDPEHGPSDQRHPPPRARAAARCTPSRCGWTRSSATSPPACEHRWSRPRRRIAGRAATGSRDRPAGARADLRQSARECGSSTLSRPPGQVVIIGRSERSPRRL